MSILPKDSEPEVFSFISGFNIYSQTSQNIQVLGRAYPVIRHIRTRRDYYYVEFQPDFTGEVDWIYWNRLIQSPTPTKYYIWPIDLIKVDSKYALVFPIREFPHFIPLVPVLIENDSANNEVRRSYPWGMEQAWVKKLVGNLLEAWSDLNRLNYAYHEFSADNLFFEPETGNVLFNFSFSTQRIDKEHPGEAVKVNENRIAADFADSYFYSSESQSQMDLLSDFYSEAVILFRLLIGKFPYQGKVMTSVSNNDEQEHRDWLKVYHKNTYFIFDEKDATNHLGIESTSDFKERWNSLSVPVRNMFHNEFQEANVQRQTDKLFFYTPNEWQKALFGESEPVELVYRTPVGGQNEL